MKTIVLTGGGTGGHIFPNISLLPHLKKYFQKIYYIGSNGMEKELISRQKGVIFLEIPARKLNRKSVLKNLTLPFHLLKSTCQSRKLLKKIKPDVIFSKGGYVSVPVCVAGKMLKIPLVSHESDMTLGRANRLIYKLCNKLCTSFDVTAKPLKKGVFTGTPIREQLHFGDKKEGEKIAQVDASRPTILVVGGSSGATDLNEMLHKILPKLLEKYNVVHLAGKGKVDKNISFKNYCQMEFCQNIEHLFALSSVVVSRAGSNAIFELLFLKKPMLLIPLPRGVSRGDQVDNAKYFQSRHLASVLEQKDMTEENLLFAINELYQNREKIAQTQSLGNPAFFSGAENICKIILATLADARS